MRTAEEILNDLSSDTTTKGRVKFEDALSAMKAYASEACREQREICAGEIAIYQRKIKVLRDAEEVIKNAPSPEMK